MPLPDHVKRVFVRLAAAPPMAGSGFGGTPSAGASTHGPCAAWGGGVAAPSRGAAQAGHAVGGSGPQPQEVRFGITDSRELALERHFRLFDRNGDGTIALEEMEEVLLDVAAVEGGREAADGGWTAGEVGELHRLLDANGDGRVTREEYLAAMRRADVEGNGGLVDKLVQRWRHNGYQKPRAERGEWRRLLDAASTAVKPRPRDAGIDAAILRGAVGGGSAARAEVMRAARRTLRFLLSSTFTDTNEERNFLLADVLPFLQEYARRLGGFEAQIVEMRWGIRADAADNHETSEICMEELERCARESLGVSYVFLAAQKYGFRPFPNRIPRDYFERLLGAVQEEGDRKLLGDWFQLDLNAVVPEREPDEWDALADFRGPPGPCYVLKSKAGVEGKAWWSKFEAMQGALRAAARAVWPEETSEEALRDPRRRHFAHKFFISVTEEEFTLGLLQPESKGDSTDRRWAFLIRRRFEGLDEAKVSIKDWIDVKGGEVGGEVDVEAQEMLRAQIAMAPLEDVALDCTLAWGPGVDHGRLEHVRYLKGVADCVCREAAESLLAGAQTESVAADTVVEEAALHLRFALERAGKFCETGSTKKVTEGILRYLERKGEERDGDTAIVVWGKSGAGKTYLMSRMVSNSVGEREAGCGNLVVRFLGTTPASSNVQDLLSSLCGQLSRAYGKPLSAVPTEFKKLVKLFKEAVVEWPSEGKPLTLVLDSVDQLDDSNGGRKLEWLPVKELGKHTRLVISTLPDYNEFECKSLLEKSLGGTEKKLLEVETISDHERVFRHMLKLKGRTATEKQIQAMSTAFQKRTNADAAGTPLWLTIVAQVVCKWRSFDGVKYPISSSVRGMILDLFKRLEARHGKALARATLGYITLCQKTGLSESELVHLLSLNDGVLTGVYEWWVPPVRTLPVLVVSRLLQDLGPYLSRRGDGSGAELVVWYHRQFWEAADAYVIGSSECYLNREHREKLHKELAEYFSGEWAGKPKPYDEGLCKCVQREKFFPGEWEAKRMVPAQPLALSGSLHTCEGRQLNVRRLTELVNHLIQAGEEELAVKELCSIAYVAAKFAAGAESALMREFGDALQHFPASSVKLVGFRAFVGRNMQHLRKAVCPLVPFQLALQEPDESYEYNSALAYSEKHFPKSNEQVAKHESALLGGAFLGWANPGQKPQAKDPCMLHVAEHEDSVNGVVFSSPDSKWFASCSDDTTVKICVVSTGEVSSTFQHNSKVKCVDWSKDGTRVASGCEDGTLHVWDPKGQKLCSLQGHSKDNPECTCARQVDKEGHEDAMNTNPECPVRGHSGAVWSVAWNHDGSLLASGSEDGTVWLWSPDGQEKGTLRGHSGEVKCVAWNHEGSLLASGSMDRTVCLWSPDGQQKGTLRGHSRHNPECTCRHYEDKDSRWEIDVNAECPVTGHSDCVWCVAWNHDGSLLASASEDKTVRLWTPDGQEKGTLKGHTEDNRECTCNYRDRRRGQVTDGCPVRGHSYAVSCVAWNHEGSLLASGSIGGTVHFLSPDGQEKGTLGGRSGWVNRVAWSHDGSLLGTASNDNTVRLWSPVCQEQGTLTGHSLEVNDVAWNHDGSLLASASSDKAVRLWTSDGQEKGTLTGHSDCVWCVAWNHDGSLLASASEDKTVRLWTPDGQEKGTLRGHTRDNPECTCRHSLDSHMGQWLVDINAECPVRGHSGPVECVAWNHDGSLLASAGGRRDNTVRLWDPKTHEHKGTLRGHSGWFVAWNHEGSLLGTACKDGTVRLWTPDGQEKGTMRGHSRHNPECTCRHYKDKDSRWEIDLNAECPVRGHSGAVSSVAFSPCSKILASASVDRTVKLWDLSGETPVEKGTLTGHSGNVWSVEWNHDGSLLASVSTDGTVRLWSPDGQEKSTLKGSLASWQGLDRETKELSAKVEKGGSAGSNRTDQYIVIADADMVYVYKTNSDGEVQGEPLACFRSPVEVYTVNFRGTKVVVGCYGQVSNCPQVARTLLYVWAMAAQKLRLNAFGARVPLPAGTTALCLFLSDFVSLSMRM